MFSTFPPLWAKFKFKFKFKKELELSGTELHLVL